MHPAMAAAKEAVDRLAALLRARGLDARPGRQGHLVGCDAERGRVWVSWDHTRIDMHGGRIDSGSLTVTLDPATGVFAGTVSMTMGAYPAPPDRSGSGERQHDVRFQDAAALAREIERRLGLEG